MDNRHTIDFSENNIITISLYQWDKGQTFVFDKDYNGKELQFSDGSVKVINNDIATVPDLLLQTSGSISAWVQVIEADGETTIKKIVINVKPRAKKDDYIQPEDEPTFREQIEEILDETKAIAESVRADADAGKFNGADGKDGAKGDKGDPGNDYILTPADKSEIADTVKNELQPTITEIASDITNINVALNGKQNTLVSGTNIKTINGIPVLGEGNIDIQGGSGGMSYYLVTCDMVHFYHDGVQLTYTDLVDKYNDENYFLYAECNGLTFIPSLPPLEEDPIIEFINTSIYGGVATITRLIMNSDNEVKYNDIVVAEKSDISKLPTDIQINGTSIVGANKVANIPYASNTEAGLIQGGQYGINVSANHRMYCSVFSKSDYDTSPTSFVVGKGTLENVLDNEAIRVDKVQSYTEEQKAQARANLGIVSAEGVLF